ncbi:hypothetical protein ZWY2020_010420 [Hordeum vulgare]|nr:hypothetical protein ZWY2020_010420 [Hordeum vulgare]
MRFCCCLVRAPPNNSSHLSQAHACPAVLVALRRREIHRRRARGPSDLIHDWRYAVDSPLWDRWLCEEHDVRRRSYFAGRPASPRLMRADRRTPTPSVPSALTPEFAALPIGVAISPPTPSQCRSRREELEAMVLEESLTPDGANGRASSRCWPSLRPATLPSPSSTHT